MKHVFSKYRRNMDSAISKSFAAHVEAEMPEKTQREFVLAFDECAPKLYRFCLLRVGSRELAEDLVSQTFLNAWRYIQSGKSINLYSVFLYRTLRNLMADHWRSKHSRTILIDKKMEETVADTNTLFADLNEFAEYRRVIDALSELPRAEQDVLHWRFVDGLSTKEISQLSGKKAGAIYVSIFRSLNKLKDKFHIDHA